jgi:hypothetical protein
MLILFMKTLLAARVLAAFLQGAPANEEMERRLDQLAARVNQLESRPQTNTIIHEKESQGAVLFLFGVVCALWAQNTDRNPWLWFFLGMLFSIVTVLVLLAKNSEDRKRLVRDVSPG